MIHRKEKTDSKTDMPAAFGISWSWPFCSSGWKEERLIFFGFFVFCFSFSIFPSKVQTTSLGKKKTLNVAQTSVRSFVFLFSEKG